MTPRIVLVGESAQRYADQLSAAGFSVLSPRREDLARFARRPEDLWLAGGEALALLAPNPRAVHNARDADRRIIAVDARSKELLGLAARVAATDVSVLISGESGTGKEVLSRFLHDASQRAAGPFCAINCAAIPESMLEAELFGHEKGAFTGAVGSRAGKFEQAHGGTLLLDEVTEMPVLLQAKLLRVLQEKEVERLGGRAPKPVDVRVIATTNRDPRVAVSDGCLREDLYYRLNVFPLHMPALRERPADVAALVRHFIGRYSPPERAVALEPGVLERLCEYHWPGNIRELENVVQRLLVLAVDGRVELEHLQLGDGDMVPGRCAAPDAGVPLRSSLAVTEHAVIRQALVEHRGNRNATARALGISERTLRYKLARLREQGVDLLADVS